MGCCNSPNFWFAHRTMLTFGCEVDVGAWWELGKINNNVSVYQSDSPIWLKLIITY